MNPQNPRDLPQTATPSPPWSVDRYGRLLAGSSVLLATLLGLLHHPAWFAGTLLAAANLVVAALTDHCALRDLLLRLGAKEREDLFLPGGIVRKEIAAAPLDNSKLKIQNSKLPA